MGAVVIDAIRTPRGSARETGSLHPVKPAVLLAGLFEALRERHALDTAVIGDAIIGCVTQTGEQGGNVGKVAAQLAGWDAGLSGVTINRYCASGLSAVAWAALQAEAGDAAIVAGGIEMMSRVKMMSDRGPLSSDPEIAAAVGYLPLPLIADIVATRAGIAREECDAYAALSQARAAQALAEGRFARSTIPVRDGSGRILLERDETNRPATTTETLAALKPVFEPGAGGLDDLALARNRDLEAIRHVHTVGNSPAMADGAALSLIASEDAARRLGLRPRAKILAQAEGAAPGGLTGDLDASRRALARAGLSAGDIDLFEVRDSFAAATIHYMRELGVPAEKFNVNGSSIALGHPLGATGVMLVATLLDELERRGLRRGLAAITGALGVATAVIIERID